MLENNVLNTQEFLLSFFTVLILATTKIFFSAEMSLRVPRWRSANCKLLSREKNENGTVPDFELLLRQI